jgi:hypothetical protein
VAQHTIIVAGCTVTAISVLLSAKLPSHGSNKQNKTHLPSLEKKKSQVHHE